MDQGTYTEIARLKRQLDRFSAAEAYKIQGSTFPADNLYKGKLFFRQDTGHWGYYEPSFANGGLFNGPAGNWYVANKGVTDTFTRANSATTLGNTETYQIWVPQKVSIWGVTTNRAYNPSNTNQDLVFVETGLNNPTIQYVANGIYNSAPGVSIPNLVVRALDNNNYLFVQPYNNLIELYKVDAGVLGLLTNTAQTLTNSTDTTITVVCAGAAISIYVNGTLRIGYTLAGADLKYVNYTQHGFYYGYGAGSGHVARWDNFNIRQVF